MQQKQSEWAWQWKKVYDDNQWLLTEWIWPNTLEDFRGKTVLDCGCGGGQHLNMIAPYAASMVGVDLNALESAKGNTESHKNIELIEADIANMQLKKTFDIVYSIGVLHHTDNPDASFRNVAMHCKPEGKVIVWVYSHEGNALNKWFLEPIKRALVRFLPRSVVWVAARVITALMYIPIYTIYLLPFSFLPFYHYFRNWRRLSYERNVLNVFDKLNAPQTWFITRSQIEDWFAGDQFRDIHISHYKGVSWRGSAVKR